MVKINDVINPLTGNKLLKDLRMTNIVVATHILVFEGAINEEFYEDALFKITDQLELYVPKCEDEICPHEYSLRKSCEHYVHVNWHDFERHPNGFEVETNINKFASFTILEEGEVYGTGIVFSLI